MGQIMGGSVKHPNLTLFEDYETLQPQLVPVEINLEGWTLFSRRRSNTSEDKVIDIRESKSMPDGRRLDQLWQVTALHGYSLPGLFDEDVFVGVMALVKRRGGMPKDGRIRFSTYELVKVLGKGKRGKTFAKVREALDRIAATSYYSENAFVTAEGESLESYRFHLWTMHFSHATSKDGKSAEHHTLKFDDLIVRSYNSGYLKLLDTDLYFRLTRPLAKALYRLVDQRRGESRHWSVDVRQLRDLLAMSKSYKASSRIWEVLEPSARALESEKYLESARLDLDGVARFVVHADFARDWYPEVVDTPPSLREQAVEALKSVGVWPKRARTLVNQHGPEKAFHALDVYEVQNTSNKVTNPGSYVAGIVETGDPDELAELAEFRAAQRRRDSESTVESQPSLTKYSGVSPAEGSPPPLPPDPAAQEILDLMLADLAETTNATVPRIWFADVVAVGLTPDRITLSAPNAFTQTYIETRLIDHLLTSLRTHHTPHATIEIIPRSSTPLD